MAGWHHRLHGHGFEWTPGVGDGQGGLVCCGSWGHKESDTTETELNWSIPLILNSILLYKFPQLFRIWIVCLSLIHVRLLVTPRTVTLQVPLSVGFSRQEYWSGLPRPPPGDLPNLGIESRSPALQADSLPSEPPESQFGLSLLLFSFILKMFYLDSDLNWLICKMDTFNYLFTKNWLIITDRSLWDAVHSVFLKF